MSSGIDPFSGSGDHPIKCISKDTQLLAGCCILLQLPLLDLVVFADVDSVECPRSDASNIHCHLSVIFQKNLTQRFCRFSTIVEAVPLF